MHEAERASRAMRAVPSSHGEPVHPCTQNGSSWGVGGSAQGRMEHIFWDKLQRCQQRSKARSGAFAPLAKASRLSQWREGGTLGPPLCHGHSSPFLCAAGNLCFLLPSAAPCSIATICGSHVLLISPAGSGHCCLQSGAGTGWAFEDLEQMSELVCMPPGS